MDIVIGLVVGLVVGLVIGLLIARASGRGAVERAREDADRNIRAVAEAVERGGLPDEGEPGSGASDLRAALERGWAPREREHQRALQEALSRVGGFLDHVIRAPLSGAGADADAAELRERIGHALGGLEDLEFFLREPGKDVEKHDLGSLVHQVTREFTSDQRIGVRVSLGDRPVRVRVDGPALMDAVYLVLHNAGRFGEGATIDVTIAEEGGRGVLVVRDRGPGFSGEALRRAFDPFYSTTADGLGLGLPQARKIVEGMGGEIALRNVTGGAEVELSFPTA